MRESPQLPLPRGGSGAGHTHVQVYTTLADAQVIALRRSEDCYLNPFQRGTWELRAAAPVNARTFSSVDPAGTWAWRQGLAALNHAVERALTRGDCLYDCSHRSGLVHEQVFSLAAAAPFGVERDV
jgi:hypothetical protein